MVGPYVVNPKDSTQKTVRTNKWIQKIRLIQTQYTAVYFYMLAMK